MHEPTASESNSQLILTHTPVFHPNTSLIKQITMGNDGNHQQPAAAAAPEGMDIDEAVAQTNMSYFDRLVDELEPDLEEEDGGDYEENTMDEVMRRLGEEDALEYALEDSDDELEYDTDVDELKGESDDEDSPVEIMEADNQPRVTPRGDLSDAAKATLWWRLDKDESLSDWFIRVTSPGGSTKVYHVHRRALVCGQIKSGYFETLFKAGQFKDCTNDTSDFEYLPADVAVCFPAFLDYLYCPPIESSQHIIKPDNWDSLEYLADFFAVPELKKGCGDFIKESMGDLGKLQDYLSARGDFKCLAGSSLSEYKLVERATRTCAERILSIKEDSSLLPLLPPDMIKAIFRKLGKSGDIKSLSSEARYHICRLAIVCFKARQGSLSEDQFVSIALRLMFPTDLRLAGLVAVDLLEIMKQTGWIGHAGLKYRYVVALSQYLESSGFGAAEIGDITCKVPQDVINILLVRSTNARNEFKVRCNVASGGCGMPEGSNIEICVRHTDSVWAINYLVGRELNIVQGYVGHRLGGVILNSGKTIAECGITSESQLRIEQSGTTGNICVSLQTTSS